MVDDLLNETLEPLSQCAKYYPTRASYPTLWRHYKKGVRGVKLETVDVGGRPYSSKEAVHRFFKATTAIRDGNSVNCAPSRQRQAAIAKAEAELEAAGI